MSYVRPTREETDKQAGTVLFFWSQFEEAVEAAGGVGESMKPQIDSIRHKFNDGRYDVARQVLRERNNFSHKRPELIPDIQRWEREIVALIDELSAHAPASYRAAIPATVSAVSAPRVDPSPAHSEVGSGQLGVIVNVQPTPNRVTIGRVLIAVVASLVLLFGVPAIVKYSEQWRFPQVASWLPWNWGSNQSQRQNTAYDAYCSRSVIYRLSKANRVTSIEFNPGGSCGSYIDIKEGVISLVDVHGNPVEFLTRSNLRVRKLARGLDIVNMAPGSNSPAVMLLESETAMVDVKLRP